MGILFVQSSKSNQNHINNELTYNELVVQLEEKIEGFLLNVAGIKKVEAIITVDTEINASLDSYSNLITDSDYSKILPNVSGIAIACTNGDNYDMKIKITKLISAYLGLPANRIEIVSFG